MKYTDIKNHLKPYSIFGSRKTTVNHAFASALAPYTPFDHNQVREALSCLSQDANDLTCVYCDDWAETWDHLVSVVKDSELHGFGHQLGNLVPCCKKCNSKKGNREWRVFFLQQSLNEADYEERQEKIALYLSTYAVEIDLAKAREQKADWDKYTDLRQQVFALMREADEIAERLRISIVPTDTTK